MSSTSQFKIFAKSNLVYVSLSITIAPVDSHIIPPNLENSNEKEKSLSIKSPTASQINKKLFKCFIIIIAKWLILEFTSSTYIISTKWAIEIPEKVYQVQKNQYKPILIQHGLLTLTEYVSLKEWMMTFIFNTKSLFNQPWMASSPRTCLLPVRNLLTTFVPRKIANMMGVLGAFAISSLLHEYIIIGNYNIWAGEQTFFFMIHGVIFILWEAIFVFPAFIEPSLRNYKLSSIPTFTTVYVQRFINNL
uniref:Wax synthase domain-containing protein n=1 Tax=Rhizophagus irregularis (strain DAOM 181602 / DAOM 197198 / MUCL 43194) TaxID=747089 RepID=U9V2A9_RHIID